MWRKSTGAKPSSPASSAQEAAQTPAAKPVQSRIETPDGEETRLAAAAVALEKQSPLAQEQALNVPSESASAPAAASQLDAKLAAMAVSVLRNPPPVAAKTSEPESPVPTPAADASPSRVNSGIKIHGEISGNTDLYIDGEVQGKLRFGQASVTVGPSGRVQADIEAREIIVLGIVQGTLRAAERVHLGGESRVKGNLLTPRIAIDDGARLSGKVDMTRNGTASAADETAKRDDLGKGDAMRAAV